MKQRILSPGRNCWRIARADRAAFLVDGEAYFSALKATLEQAMRSVLILAWDIDSRIDLVRNGDNQKLPAALGDFLNALAAERRRLHVRILAWDFAMIYALEREWLPVYKLDWRSHRRVRLRTDDKHPVGASHHQKIVVVDDTTAFVGGFDLTRSRWDTPEHKPNDPRRVDPYGLSYPPFHDVQVMVQGETATALAELARQRWRRATGRRVPVIQPPPQAPWPPGLEPDLETVEVAIARTQPAYPGAEAAREVEQLNLDMIAAAKRFIYIENQYLTSSAVGEALANRLRQREGPEVVLVLPRDTRGWLEQATMDVLRARLLRKLREADQHGRLRVYYPDAPGLGKDCIEVHAKLMVVDDNLVRVGSSNLSNRSMRLDTECDVAIEAAGNKRLQSRIAKFRNRLLAEHLGCNVQAVAKAIEENASLIEAVEHLHGSERTLRELEGTVPEFLDERIPSAAIVDPEQPLDPDKFFAEWLVNKRREKEHTGWPGFLGILATLLIAAAAWRWTPLHDYLDVTIIAQWLASLNRNSLGPLIAVAGFTVGGLLVIPVTVLIVVTALVFGPILGFAYSLLGAVLAAGLAYGIGCVLGRDSVRRFAGSRLNKLSQQLGRRGLISVITLRVLPIAPFTVVNLVAGASHIRFRDFILGTLLGMTPGVLAMSVFADRLYNAIVYPNPLTMTLFAAVVAVIGVAAVIAHRWLGRRTRKESSPESG